MVMENARSQDVLTRCWASLITAASASAIAQFLTQAHHPRQPKKVQ